jgi:hypothetical protein
MMPARSWPGGPGCCHRGAPTEPDVRTLAHPVPQPAASPSSRSLKLFTGVTLTCGLNLDVFSMFPSGKSAGRRFAFLDWVLQGEFPSFIGTIKALRRPAAISPHFVSFAWRYLCVHSFSSLPDGRVHRQGPELVTRYLQPGIRRGANRVLPSSWGTTIVRLHMFPSDAGRTAYTRTIAVQQRGP